MKILLVQETDWLDRGPFQQNHLMERLALRSHEIRVIDHEILWRTHGRKGLWSKRQVFSGISRIHKGGEVTVIRPGIIKIPHLDYASLLISRRREIDRQIKEFKPDIIIGFQVLSAYLGMQVARKYNLPFVYYWVDVYHTQIPFMPYQFVGKMLEKKTLRNANRVLVINEKLKDYVVLMGSNSEKTHLIRGSVDLELFNLAINGNTIREQYGIKKDDDVLLFVGWLDSFSGLKEAALQLAGDKNHNLKLLVVGEGDVYDELQKIQEKYNLHGRLILTGKKPYQEIPLLIAAADICLLPAYPWEPIMQDIVPIKMYEYMAMKKPVIATRLPGVIKEFGEDNGVVYIDKPEDAVAKAAELIQNGEVKELGSKARSFVEKYSWDNITDEFEGILEEVIRGKDA